MYVRLLPFLNFARIFTEKRPDGSLRKSIFATSRRSLVRRVVAMVFLRKTTRAERIFWPLRSRRRGLELARRGHVDDRLHPMDQIVPT